MRNFIHLGSIADASTPDAATPSFHLLVDSRGHLVVDQRLWIVDSEEPGRGEWGPRPTLSGNAVDLGTNPDVRIGRTLRNDLERALGFAVDSLPDVAVGPLIAHHVLGDRADAAGTARAKPLRGSVQRPFRFLAHGEAATHELVNETFNSSHSNLQPTLDVRWVDYRAQKAAGTPLDVLQRWTGYDAWALLGTRNLTISDLAKLLPPECIDDGWAIPRSALGDTFVEGSDTDLENHTPTGANAGTGWTEVSGGASGIVVNATNDRAQGGIPTSFYIMDDELSTDDHSCQGLLSMDVDGAWTTRFVAIVVRGSNSAFTCYLAGFDRGSGVVGNYRIYYVATGTYNQVATVGSSDTTSNNTCKLEDSASALELFAPNGTSSVLTGTDTNITAVKRIGVAMDHTGADRTHVDTLVATDLVVAAVKFRPKVMVF